MLLQVLLLFNAGGGTIQLEDEVRRGGGTVREPHTQLVTRWQQHERPKTLQKTGMEAPLRLLPVMKSITESMRSAS